ncbi:MAG: aromatic ring hydroxylase, partial [Candidatus Thorarchaeota archaeon]
MITGERYREKLLKMEPNIFIGGEKVGRDDSRLQGVIGTISQTFDRLEEPEFKELLAAQSHISGQTVNRFTHIHQSVDDLLKKQEMTRKLCRYCGGCVFRCMGIDAMNTLSIITHRAETMTGRPYNQRFLEYLRYWQENDVVGTCAQTDPKGNRALRPHQQSD